MRHDPASEPRDERHEELCAYLLDELDAPARERLEARLASDPALAAEKARLEATIGLVRGTFAVDGALSPEALEHLLDRATPRPPARGWRSAGVLRAAAAVTALAGGVWTLVHLAGPGATGDADEQVASAPVFTYTIFGESPLEGAAQKRLEERLGARSGAAPDAEAPASAREVTREAPREAPARAERLPAETATRGVELRFAGVEESTTGGRDTLGREAAGSELETALRRLEEASPRGPESPGPASPGPTAGLLSLGASPGAAAPPSAGAHVFTVTPGRGAGDPETQLRQQLQALGYASDDGDHEAGVEGRAYHTPHTPSGGVAGQDPAAPPIQLGETLLRLDLDGAARAWVVDEVQRDSELDPETRAQLELERILADCRALPRERPRDMFFRFWGDNPFELTSQDPLSTFAVDVDTASYTLARRMLREGHLPEKAQVRTEEFVNFFDPDLPAPLEDTFAVSLELAPSPYGGREDRWLLRVGLRAKDVDVSRRDPLALTFVVDVSGSMKENQRLELVKHALRLLVAQLDGRDTIALVAFSNEARVILPATSAAQRGVIESAVHQLQPEGGTNAEAGLHLGYELAAAALDPASHSRVVFLSDGVANIGQTDQDRISEDVARLRRQGIFLNTVGVGMSNHDDEFLEQLANRGDGICDYVGDAADVQRALVDRFIGAFVPVARDVKVQLEFDPAQVLRYRQLGYENRAIADSDFRDDTVDAGEVGAGHQVVCLYELERTSSAGDGPLATARVRWLPPRAVVFDEAGGAGARELEVSLAASDALADPAGASTGFRLSAVAAQFAEFLRRSVHTLGDSYEELRTDAHALAAATGDEDVRDLASLVDRTAALVLARSQRTDIERLRDELRALHIRLHAHDLGERPLGDDLEACRRELARLEAELQTALRAEHGARVRRRR